MKRLSTIIKEISTLERMLYENYSANQIIDCIDELEATKQIPISCTGLISVIYEGALNDIAIDYYMEDNTNG